MLQLSNHWHVAQQNYQNLHHNQKSDSLRDPSEDIRSRPAGFTSDKINALNFRVLFQFHSRPSRQLSRSLHYSLLERGKHVLMKITSSRADWVTDWLTGAASLRRPHRSCLMSLNCCQQQERVWKEWRQVSQSVRGHPYMMSTKLSDFLTPSP